MDRYSRFVAWLKVLLPLTALALLSTLFLLSRNTDPVATVPFADDELLDRVRDEQITGPFFSGTTTDGDRVSVAAGTMRTGLGKASTVEDLSAQIDMLSGTRIILFSDSGAFDMSNAQSNLTGNVVITTSTGFKMTTDSLNADFDTMRVEAPQPVTANSPFGTLNAGQMRMEKRGAGENAHLIFTDGVKLVYDPTNLEE
ncbi:LPS export ABC transporter periplasmic protein LptC [uncultured Tateyamaria sp.]|uniref:LPS export ABC transporter periplasmic protein LptC n=1 Tax=Tateyamaria sp. 1078 TaxID=3417464 RepID=UPI00262E9E48|nr:LPS export ABC transporter periplasmic protein LptC [uncultured Tateyamaria sp.]